MPLPPGPGENSMQRVKHPPIRNKIDMTDPAQVRAWTRRLRLRANELAAIIEKVGNSAGAVTKEVELQRAPQQPVASSAASILTDATEPKLTPAA